ncbi:ORF6N domain-containing protein [Lactococcus garvieae]|uniref:ORF6N domain-containing protein n=1 Tax=Lactococcus garvieae TaxID=1363 RepID=UPI003853EAEA
MNQLQITELNGQRVLTTQQIAEGYGTKPRTIVDNFNNNKPRFEEGKHFILLEGEYLREFKRKNEIFGFAQNMNKLYLWTEKGALLHAKSLGTDQAWDMYDVLVDTYFKVKKIEQQQIPTTQRELAQLALAANEETAQRMDVVESKLHDLEENKLITTEDKGTIDSYVRKKVSTICRDQHLDSEARSLLFQDLGSSIKKLFNVPNRGRIKDKDFLQVLDFVSTWEPSSVTKAKINQLHIQ